MPLLDNWRSGWMVRGYRSWMMHPVNGLQSLIWGERVLAMWLKEVPVHDGLTVGWVDTVQESWEGSDT